jgi:hypothetical protein
MTLKPSLAMRWQMAVPMPPMPPVTYATFFDITHPVLDGLTPVDVAVKRRPVLCWGWMRGSRSTVRATPMPPPMHSARNALLRVALDHLVQQRDQNAAPDAPMGCPMAIAPPLTLTLLVSQCPSLDARRRPALQRLR